MRLWGLVDPRDLVRMFPMPADSTMALTAAKDPGNLKAAGGSHPPSGLRNRLRDSIEGTEDLGQIHPTDMQIDGGRCGRAVAQKHLNMMEAGSRLNQMGGEAVP